LKAAGGQVHCGRCNQIFNALQGLRDSGFSETPEPEPRDGLPEGPSPSHTNDEPVDDMENVSLSQLFKDSLADDALVQHYGNLATEPGADAGPPRGTDPVEAPTSRIIDEPRETGQTEDALFASRSELSEKTPPEPDTNENKAEDNLDDIPIADGDFTATNKHSVGATLGWTFGILILLAGALAQLSWLERDRLLNYPGVREAFEQVCGLVGCRLEPRRAPERIKILDRSVTSHPTVADALQIQLIFSNKAAFPQPYPKLRLGLYSTDNQLVAQRLFNPGEYLSEDGSEHLLLNPDQQVMVEMALEDPGDKVTGFRFDFF
jgi:hypothetical protein